MTIQDDGDDVEEIDGNGDADDEDDPRGADANVDDDAGGVCCARVESVALLEWPDSREKWKTLVKRASKNEINNYTTQDKRIR